MRRLVPLILPLVLAACAPTGIGRPVLPGTVNAPPPAIPAAAATLPMGLVWSWQGTQMSDGTRFVPEAPGRYTLEFQPGGRVSVRADCNRGSATYVQNGEALDFGPIALTRMLCPPGSHDGEFLKGLAAVSGQIFDGGDLVLRLRVAAGSMRFTSSRP
jgi:heat shock protein HslJ